jgi:hypothetical protein
LGTVPLTGMMTMHFLGQMKQILSWKPNGIHVTRKKKGVCSLDDSVDESHYPSFFQL